MRIQINDKTVIKYYIVKVVDGIEVRRTEIKPTDRGPAGRFIEREAEPGVTPDIIAKCPNCGHKFRVGCKK